MIIYMQIKTIYYIKFLFIMHKIKIILLFYVLYSDIILKKNINIIFLKKNALIKNKNRLIFLMEILIFIYNIW